MTHIDNVVETDGALILGAGIAGMVAALELGKAGYRCIVLEARARPGGRNWTLRGGDTIAESDSTQAVGWDGGEHLYFNPGPGRIPHHHQGILGYCRALGVPLEVMCNDNRAAWLHDRLKTGRSRLLELPHSDHLVALDRERQSMIDATLSFLDEPSAD